MFVEEEAIGSVGMNEGFILGRSRKQRVTCTLQERESVEQTKLGF